MNGGAHRLHRLLTLGFDTAPYLLEPRNPAYYVRLFEAQGFRRLHSWSTYELDREGVRPLVELVRRGADRAREVATHRGLHLDPRPDPLAILSRLHPILDRAWASHVGYSPMDADELAQTFAGLLAIMDRSCLGVVERVSGGDEGFAFSYPDDVDRVRALDGDASGRASWVGQATSPRLVFHTIAFLPEARKTGVPFLLYEGGLEHFLAGGFEKLILALVTEDLRFYERVAEKTREYALYERSLDARV